MKERPILFSGPMVRALLDGSKTQTRRAMKPQPMECPSNYPRPGHWWPSRVHQVMLHVEEELQNKSGGWGGLAEDVCPYGRPGDRHWVRESWAPDPPSDGTWGYTAWAGCREGQIAGVPERFRHPRHCLYAANWAHEPIRWTPSIHMPRWASRITLEVVSVRIERLQDISEADAVAEGIETNEAWPGGFFRDYSINSERDVRCLPPRDSYRTLWEQINGPGSWDANPWVWVIEFKRIYS